MRDSFLDSNITDTDLEIRWEMQQAVQRDIAESRHRRGQACSGAAYRLIREQVESGKSPDVLSNEFTQAVRYQNGEMF